MSIKISLLLLVGLAGCAHTGHEETVFNDGRPAFETSCNGFSADYEACMTEAATTCGGRYAVLSTAEFDFAANAHSPSYAGPMVNRNMVYRCEAMAH